MRTYILIFTLLLITAGCALMSQAYTLDETKIPSIQDDVTTKAQITAIFGQPQVQNTLNRDGSVWIYHDVTSGEDSEQPSMSRKKLKRIKQKLLTIYFRGDIVTNHYYQ